MLISIERKAVHHSQRLAELKYLFLILAAMVIPFHTSMAADAVSPSSSCLLAFGDIPQKRGLLPGISKGVVNPGAVRVADPLAKTSTWSEPDRQELGIMWHYIEISTSRFRVRAAYSDAPPYHVEMLALRDPAVALPCGLRVGQPMDQFIKALGEYAGNRIEYSGHEYRSDSVAPDILILPGSDGDIQEIRWEYVAD